MSKYSVKEQLRQNLVAIISLIVALTTFSYNTWRNERTEQNRNIRPAAFELLKELGQLQVVVNNTLYRSDESTSNPPIIGWGHISFIGDMGKILPDPVPQKIERLIQVWGDNWQNLPSNEISGDKISAEIDSTRSSVLNQLKNLK